MAYAHSSLGDVVVWEWMNDFGAWVAYQPEASNYIEVGSSQHQNRIKLGDADSNLSSLVVELQKFCQISSNGEKCSLFVESVCVQASLHAKRAGKSIDSSIRKSSCVIGLLQTHPRP